MVDLSKRSFFSRKQLDPSAIRLPWLASPDTFTHDCTRCSKCLEHCETNIVVKGDGGFPTIDFTAGECTFCYQCASSCPEDLFLDINQKPWNAEIAINSQCLAKQNVECRSCGDMCEPMAIQFKPEIGKVSQPILNLDECTGCGACVAVCPTSSINVSHAK